MNPASSGSVPLPYESESRVYYYADHGGGGAVGRKSHDF